MIAIRVDRVFEALSSEPLVFTDASGNISKVPVMDNTGVNDIYKGSNGLSGNSAWGTRNSWVSLTAVKDNTIITLAFFDHPGNPGYPAYTHAQGYGLFALNNLGQKSFNHAEKPSIFILWK